MDIIRSNERGTSTMYWLHSHHTFSFASYHNPDRMGVSALRVINDDQVIPDGGFATHPHKDMEIISYVKSGTIEHKDSMGNIQSLPAGEFQLMSAGSGVTHSEYNPSSKDDLEFLQIWIIPNEKGGKPQYQQKRFEQTKGLQLIASPDGTEGSLILRQNARLYELKTSTGTDTRLHITPGRTLYVHVITGELDIDGTALHAGDGAALTPKDAVALTATEQGAHALVFDLP